jgi:hypothetical protein
MGTADYAAPEQFLDARGVEAAADIYSLGCTLYHLLAGGPPFGKATHPDNLSKARAHLNEAPPDLRRQRPEVPEGLSAVLGKMLAKDPQQRYASMAEVAAALAAFTIPPAAQDTPSLPKKVIDGPQKHKRRGLWVAVGLAAALVVALLAWAPWKGRDRPTPPDTRGVDDVTRAPVAPPAAKPLTIHMRVLRYEREGGNFHLLGELGKETYHARFDDRVEVEAELSEPAYAYLIAFNPTRDLRATATYRLPWAADSWSLAAHLACRPSVATGPAANLLGVAEAVFRADPGTAEHAVPRRVADRIPQPRERVATDGRLRLNDGVGLQVLAVVASRQPLPSYTEWRRRRPPLDWTQTAAASGAVWLTDGKTFRGVHGPDVDVRAEDEKDDKTVVRTLAEELRQMPGVEAVAVVGFAVDRAD